MDPDDDDPFRGQYTNKLPTNSEVCGSESPHVETRPQSFPNYLRARFFFHPTSTVDSTTQDQSALTIPIDQGDVVLVHTIHTSGWGDGTLLSSGSRGWFPTNFCEVYDKGPMRRLLSSLALVNDLFRGEGYQDPSVFAKTDYKNAILGGEIVQCLGGGAPLVQANAGVRRLRKALLSELSSFLKSAERVAKMTLLDEPDVVDHLDGVLLKAFRVTTKAVKFIDSWEAAMEAPLEIRPSKIVVLPISLPDPNRHGQHTPVETEIARSVEGSIPEFLDDSADVTPSGEPQRRPSLANRASTAWKCASLTFSNVSPPPTPRTRPKQLETPSHSYTGRRPSLSHRLSVLVGAVGSRNTKLVSARLRDACDALVESVALFSDLRWDSRSSSEIREILQSTSNQYAAFQTVFKLVWERDNQRSIFLWTAMKDVRRTVGVLIDTARQILYQRDNPDTLGEPLSGREATLISLASECAKSANDCLTKARDVVSDIGDFEIEAVGSRVSEAFPSIRGTAPPETPPNRDARSRGGAPLMIQEMNRFFQHDVSHDQGGETLLSFLQSSSIRERPLQARKSSLPPASSDLLQHKTVLSNVSESESPPMVGHRYFETHDIHSDSGNPSQSFATRSTHYYTRPQIGFPVSNDTGLHDQAPDSNGKRTSGKAARKSSVGVSIADSSSICLDSPTSTRATTPERLSISHQPENVFVKGDSESSDGLSKARAATASGAHQPEHALPLNNPSDLVDFDYVSRDGSFEAEQRILETTHAHELLWNGDMEIAGGSLPALIEQLTTHDAKPDQDFVFAFILTFRLFTSPATFAQSLVRRFESVGEDNLWSKPVQTRVLKVVKDWLEIYWQAHTDEEALPIIYRFAAGILGAAFPAAGKRIMDSIERVFDYGRNSVVLRLRPMTGRSHAGWT
ncbi:Ras guanine nucleotide exchange factor bud5, partial [Cryomyces antarcticus]